MCVLFLGGDMRQKYANDYLIKKGIDSRVYLSFSLDDTIIAEIKNSQVICLPLPVSKDGIYLNMFNANKDKIRISDIIGFISNESTLVGGKFSPDIKDLVINQNKKIVDYFDIETFQIKNALLSAEGAIYYAKDKFDGTIHGSKVAVLGFGRIGKILAYLLHSQGAEITVFARKDIDLAWSKLIGFNVFKIKNMDDRSKIVFEKNEYDIIFNTIPYQIMDEEFARRISKKTALIDLASYPYGIDEKIANKYDLNYHRELGIPGRYAPKAAGEMIGRIIINNILTKGD